MSFARENNCQVHLVPAVAVVSEPTVVLQNVQHSVQENHQNCSLEKNYVFLRLIAKYIINDTQLILIT